MSEEQAAEAIRLRHRLRSFIAGSSNRGAIGQTLEALSALSERLQDPGLRAEHLRWQILFAQDFRASGNH